MAQLPAAFTEQTRQLMGDERFERYLRSFDEEAPVSIRLNPRKAEGMTVVAGEPVPWCRDGWYLPRRPNFTMDPLLHAGCYYVQEASSMFLDEVLHQCLVHGSQCIVHSSHAQPNYELCTVNSGLTALDLCAAPGGKSTLLRARLAEDCMLYSNEPVRNRASVLAENVHKWGYPNHVVTNNYPRDYRASKLLFDVILCDVPCSGEGMFRKDEATIGEWSLAQVERCAALQREIVSDAWACLRDEGLLIYSTCTFNTKENEENIRWLLSEYDAEVVPVSVLPEWNITGSLLPGFTQPVYRFIPGISRGEGLFMCVVRKGGASKDESSRGRGSRLPSAQKLFSYLVPPSPRTSASPFPCPRAALTYQQAMQYLRREALVLPEDTPRGVVEVTFQGHVLGQVKNLGTRANNLYPKEWRIKTTHVPTEYEPILTPNNES